MSQFNARTGVGHYRVAESMPLTQYLAGLNVVADPAESLRFGAVYVDGRRTLTDVAVRPDQIIRLHTRPKRYPVPAEPLRLAFEHPEFVILDKPSGLPTHPTLDNVLENALHVLSRQLGYPLYVTHRLDVPTAGLLILAKTPAAQALINKTFARDRVEKIYLARAARPVAPGPYRHFIDPATHVPRAISAEPREGWWDCRLEVEEVTDEQGAFVHRVRLLTGKTHQIRAQFAALGAPLDGDERYGGRPAAHFGLACQRLAFPFRTEVIDVSRPF